MVELCSTMLFAPIAIGLTVSRRWLIFTQSPFPGLFTISAFAQKGLKTHYPLREWDLYFCPVADFDRVTRPFAAVVALSSRMSADAH